MADKSRRFLRAALAVILLLIAGIALGLIPINLFFAKATISHWVQQNAGLELEISGPLRLRLGPRPALTATLIELGSNNTTPPILLQADKLLLRTRLVSIFRRELDIRALRIDGIVPIICRETGCSPEWLPEKLNLSATAPLNDDLTIEIAGESPGGELSLGARGDSLNLLVNDPAEYRFDLDAQALSSNIRSNGKLHRPLSGFQLDAAVEFATQDLSDLLANFGIDLKNLGTFSTRADLEIDSSHFEFQNLQGALDENVFSLKLRFQGLESRPRIEIEGQIDHLDLGRFSGDGKLDEVSTATELELKPLFDQLAGFDGYMDLKVGHILNAPLAADELAVQARLDQGLLQLVRADLFLSDSPLEASGELDLRLQCPQLEAQLLIHDLDLKLLNQWLNFPAELGGDVSRAGITWKSCGSSILKHISSMRIQADIFSPEIRSTGRASPVNLDSIHLSAAWIDQGQASIAGSFQDEPLAFELGFGGIERILSGAHWPITISASNSGNILEINGNAALSENKPLIDVDIQLDVGRFGSLEWIGADPENRLPLSARSHLLFGDDGLFLENLDAHLGSSDIKGELDWSGAESSREANIRLRSGNLNFVELTTLFPASKQTPTDQNRSPSTPPEHARIENWLRYVSADIDLVIDNIYGLDHAFQDVRLQAKLYDRRIDDGRLELQIGKAVFKGNISMDFSESPGSAQFQTQLDDVNIGHLMSELGLADNLRIRADHIELQSFTRGDTLADLLEDLQVEAKMESLHWVFTSGPQEIENSVDLAALDLLISPDSQSIWRAHGEVNEIPLRAFVRSPSLPATFDKSRPLPLTLVFGAGNDVTMLEGVIDRRIAGDRHAEFTLSGDFLDHETLDFSMLVSPLSEFEISGDVTWRDRELLFRNLLAKTGKSSVSGMVDLRYLAPRYQFEVDLHSPFIETDDLVLFAEDYRDSAKLLKKQKDERSDEPTAEAGVLALIGQQFNAGTNKLDFNLKAGIDELHSAGTPLGKAHMESSSANHEFRFALGADLNGGKVAADYHGVSSDRGSEYKLDLNIERLEYGGLLRLLDPDAEGGGQVFLDTSLAATAPDPGRLQEHLAGHFDLLVIPENFQTDFLDLWASNLVFALLPLSDNRKKMMNCMVARFDVENGVMTSKNTFLDSTDVIVRARGDIDLVNRKLDLWAAPQAKREKFLSIQTPIVVTGPFENPDIDPAPGGFIFTMLRWYYNLIYVPYKWLTGERFPADGIETCFNAMGWELTADPGVAE